MHALFALIFQSMNETKSRIGKCRALGHISGKAVFIECLGVVRHADKAAAFRSEKRAQFRQREFAIGISAMNVNSALQHSTFPWVSFSRTPSARGRASRPVPAADLTA